jgi:hypothetical protein
MHLKEITVSVQIDSSCSWQSPVMGSFCQHGNRSLGSIKDREFLTGK